MSVVYPERECTYSLLAAVYTILKWALLVGSVKGTLRLVYNFFFYAIIECVVAAALYLSLCYGPILFLYKNNDRFQIPSLLEYFSDVQE